MMTKTSDNRWRCWMPRRLQCTPTCPSTIGWWKASPMHITPHPHPLTIRAIAVAAATTRPHHQVSLVLIPKLLMLLPQQLKRPWQPSLLASPSMISALAGTTWTVPETETARPTVPAPTSAYPRPGPARPLAAVMSNAGPPQIPFTGPAPPPWPWASKSSPNSGPTATHTPTHPTATTLIISFSSRPQIAALRLITHHLIIGSFQR